MYVAYEFDIPEQAFRDLAKEKSWDIQEIDSEPFKIATYRVMMTDQYPIPSLPDIISDEDVKEYRRLMAVREPSITNGLKFEIRHSNAGGISVAFDRSSQRAYVQTNPR